MVKFLGMLAFMVLFSFGMFGQTNIKPRVLISSDIGGTDPNDFQSMIHLLMYADQFQIEDLVSSPFGDGTKRDFLDIIDHYETDYNQLLKHSLELPSPNSLRLIAKQRGKVAAPFKEYSIANEGSDWIIKCEKGKVISLYGCLYGEA